MSCVLFPLQVYGALRAIDEGTHAQYTLVPQDSVSTRRDESIHRI